MANRSTEHDATNFLPNMLMMGLKGTTPPAENISETQTS